MLKFTAPKAMVQNGDLPLRRSKPLVFVVKTGVWFGDLKLLWVTSGQKVDCNDLGVKNIWPNYNILPTTRSPWNKGNSLPQLPFGVRSCEVAIIWPDTWNNEYLQVPRCKRQKVKIKNGRGSALYKLTKRNVFHWTKRPVKWEEVCTPWMTTDSHVRKNH